MRRILTMLFLVTLFVAGNAYGQVSGLSFASTAGTYTDITGGTQLATGTWDDATFSAVPIGFTFNANGTNFTTCVVSCNGYAYVSPSTTGSLGYGAISSTTAATETFAAFSRDLQGIDATSEVRYLTSGTAPNRIFTVQWKNAKRYGSNYVGEVLNIQLSLYETTNRVFFSYGAFTGSAYASAIQPEVGLRGLTNADYNNRTTTANWSASTAGATNSATMTLNSTVFPANGLTYSFSMIPPVAATLVSPILGSTCVDPTASLNWLPGVGGGPVAGFKLYYGTDNPPTNIVNGTNLGTVHTYNPTPDPLPGQHLYWQIVPFNGIGDAAGCPVWDFTVTTGFGNIQGFVTNCFGVPIGGATVVTSGCSNTSTTSAANGAYSFLNLSAGTYTLGATAPTYNNTTLSGVVVTAANTTYQNIVITSPTMAVTPNPYNVVVNPGEMFAGSLGVNNNGCGSLAWSASITYGSPVHTWLTLPSATGTVAAYTTGQAALNFDGTGLAAGTVMTANVVFTSTPNVGTVTIPVTMTVQGVALTGPTNLNGTLNQLTGAVNLTWSFVPSGTLINFIVKRNGVTIGTPTVTHLADVLPTYGVYDYTVQAVYAEGATAPATTSVEWANPTLTFAPASLHSTNYTYAHPGYLKTQTLTINNTGLGLMSFSFPDYVSPGDAPLAYCAASSTTCDEYIGNVTIGTINNSSTCAHYSNYTAMSTDLEMGVGMPISVTNPVTYSTDIVGVWCDWNHDQDFDDAGEFVQLGGGPGLFTGSIIAPVTATPGPTTMRVRIQYGGTLAPCGTASYGEVEDYSVNVVMPSFIVGVTPDHGVVPAGGSKEISVIFSSQGYNPGTYNDNLELVTNDLANADVMIPATMVVVVPATFAGTVTNGITGDPIPGVTITTSGAGIFTTTTGDDGTYSLILDAGTYDLHFTKVGFQNVNVLAQTTTAGNVTTVDAQMYENALAPSAVTALVNATDTQCDINWTAPFGPYEMLYDDGTAENFSAWAQPGNMNAVKFTPAGYPAEVQGGRVFVGDGSFPAGGNFIGQSFKMIVMRADGAAGMPGTRVDSVDVTANNFGWVDFSDLHATIAAGDFYMVMVQGSAAPNCVPVGVDETAPTAHKSYARNVVAGSAWGISPYQDLMIRAIVSSPVGGGDNAVASTMITPSKFRGMISLHQPVSTPGFEGKATLAAPAESNSDAAASYKLYRILVTDPNGNPNPAPVPADLIANPTANSYVDGGQQWLDLAQGWYVYAVAAVYPNGDVSPLVYSNIIGHKMLGKVTVNVTLTTGGSPAGTHVTLVGVDYPASTYNTTLDATGSFTWDPVWKGRYTLTAHLGGFTDYVANVVVDGTEVYNILLEEMKYKPRNLYVDDKTLLATWQEPLSVLADENFEGSVFPPDGWQATYQSSVGWFSTTDGGSAYFVIPPHTKYAVANDDAGGSSNNGCCDYLITPNYDLSGAPSYVLSFQSYFQNTYGESGTVEMSTDDGANWTVIADMVAASSWVPVDVDLAAYSGATGLSHVKFAFHANDNGQYADGWAIDDVKLSSGGIPVQGYAFFLDGALVYQPIADTFYQIDPTTINYGQCYVAGVAGIYSSGFSELDTYNFCSHFLYPPRNLQGFPNDNSALLTWEAPLTGGDKHIDASYPVATTTGAPAEASAVVSTFVPTSTGSSHPTDAAVLFDNGTIVNSPGTGPGGSDESVIAAGGANYGFGMQQSAGNSVADDFVVPSNWTINTVKFQGYQTNSGNTSTFTGAYFRIYDNNPASGGNVIWGDLTTNLMTSSSFSNIYRVNAPGEGTARPVMDIVCDGLNIQLTPGTYWIEWQTTGSGSSGPWVPPIVDPGNAWQNAAGTWGALADPTPNGLPFVLSGTGGGGGGGTPGGLLGYNLYRDNAPAPVAFIPVPELQYFDLNLAPANYCYDIKAYYDLTDYGMPGLFDESVAEGTACVNVNYGYPVPFMEDWTTGTFTTNQWTYGQNWRIAGQMGNPMPSAEFGWDPPQTDYSLSMESFYINSVPMGASTSLYKIYLDFDLALADRAATSNEKLSAEVWNGSSWVKVAEFVNNGDLAFTTQHIDITSKAKNRVFKVRFLANGAASSDIYYWLVDNIHVYYDFASALNLVVTSTSWTTPNNTAHLAWEAPSGGTVVPGEWIHYDDGVNSDAIGTGAAADFNVAIRYVPSQLANYDGWAVKKVKFFPNEAACSYSVRVWTGANAANLIVDQPVAAPTIGDWNEVDITSLPTIDAGQELWIGYRCNATTGYPAGVDAGPCVAPGSSDLITLDGILWESISQVYALDYNWNIQAFVETAGDGKVTTLQPLQKNQPATLATGTLKLDPNYNASAANLAQRTTSSVKESDNNRALTGYNIYRSDAGGIYNMIATTAATTYDDVDLDFMCYDYYVTVVYDDPAESGPSNIDGACFNVGLKPVNSGSEVNIYPNPATTSVTVELTDNVRSMTVYNYLGSVVTEMNIGKEKSVQVNTSNYAAGAYTIRFTTATGETFSKKLVIIK
jgi:hypothetical protein